MSTATFEKGHAAHTDIHGSGLPSFLGRIASRVKRYAELSRAERELSQLDDRLLIDIGLSRSDIRRMVWGGERRF